MGCCNQQPEDENNKPSKISWFISLIVMGAIIYGIYVL